VKWPPAWELGSWKGVAILRGLEPGSREITIVRSHYQATASADTIYLSIYLSIYPSIYLSVYGSTALCWTLAAFSVS
jgi:hypothetical protein